MHLISPARRGLRATRLTSLALAVSVLLSFRCAAAGVQLGAAAHRPQQKHRSLQSAALAVDAVSWSPEGGNTATATHDAVACMEHSRSSAHLIARSLASAEPVDSPANTGPSDSHQAHGEMAGMATVDSSSSTPDQEGMSHDVHSSTSQPDAEAGGQMQGGETAHGGSSSGGDGSLSLRIAAVFIVLLAGLVGCAVPMVLQGWLVRRPLVSACLRALSAGVLLALALLHVTTHAVEELDGLAEGQYSSSTPAATTAAPSSSDAHVHRLLSELILPSTLASSSSTSVTAADVDMLVTELLNRKLYGGSDTSSNEMTSLRRALLQATGVDPHGAGAHGAGQAHDHPFPMGMLAVLVGFLLMAALEHVVHACAAHGPRVNEQQGAKGCSKDEGQLSEGLEVELLQEGKVCRSEGSAGSDSGISGVSARCCAGGNGGHGRALELQGLKGSTDGVKSGGGGRGAEDSVALYVGPRSCCPPQPARTPHPLARDQHQPYKSMHQLQPHASATVELVVGSGTSLGAAASCSGSGAATPAAGAGAPLAHESHGPVGYSHGHRQRPTGQQHTPCCGPSSSPLAPTLERYRLATLAPVMELGCVFHTFILGLALGTLYDVGAVRALVIALSFHQLLEGVGLMTVLIGGGMRRVQLLLGSVVYALTCPLGIAVGIGISGSYDRHSVTARAVQGTFNGLSAGLLLYLGSALVQTEFGTAGMGRWRPCERVLLFALMVLGSAAFAILALWT